MSVYESSVPIYESSNEAAAATWTLSASLSAHWYTPGCGKLENTHEISAIAGAPSGLIALRPGAIGLPPRTRDIT